MAELTLIQGGKPHQPRLVVFPPGSRRNWATGTPEQVAKKVSEKMENLPVVTVVMVANTWDMTMAEMWVRPDNSIKVKKRPNMKHPDGLEELIRSLRILNINVEEE